MEAEGSYSQPFLKVVLSISTKEEGPGAERRSESLDCCLKTQSERVRCREGCEEVRAWSKPRKMQLLKVRW